MDRLGLLSEIASVLFYAITRFGLFLFSTADKARITGIGYLLAKIQQVNYFLLSITLAKGFNFPFSSPSKFHRHESKLLS